MKNAIISTVVAILFFIVAAMPLALASADWLL